MDSWCHGPASAPSTPPNTGGVDEGEAAAGIVQLNMPFFQSVFKEPRTLYIFDMQVESEWSKTASSTRGVIE